jgi:hypothetical protein
MTPKEKAKELVDKLKNGLWKDRGVSIYSEDAIYCALIAVDEIIKANPHSTPTIYGVPPYSTIKYWEEVKQEIDQL